MCQTVWEKKSWSSEGKDPLQYLKAVPLYGFVLAEYDISVGRLAHSESMDVDAFAAPENGQADGTASLGSRRREGDEMTDAVVHTKRLRCDILDNESNTRASCPLHFEHVSFTSG